MALQETFVNGCLVHNPGTFTLEGPLLQPTTWIVLRIFSKRPFQDYLDAELDNELITDFGLT